MPESPYDVAVLGAGPGGYVSAIRAAQLGMKVVVVEREYLGGVCSNWGCIPTKALLRSAEVAHLVTKGGREFGFNVDNVTLDYGAAVKRSRKISARVVKGVDLLFRENGIDIIWGTGKLIAPTTLEIELNDGGKQILEAKNLIIATGACPCIPRGMEPDGKHILTARHAIERTELPESAIIIGGGPIGLEIATVWSTYGSQITVVEMQDHILPTEDVEAANVLNRSLRRRKIKVQTKTRVEEIQAGESGVSVKVSSEKGISTLEAEVALVAVGFCANCMDLGLADVGVDQHDRGWVNVDGYMRTNYPNLYCVGDLNGSLLLAHVASAQGILAVETIAGIQRNPFNFNRVPRGTYTTPQVASFGLSEAKAKEAGHDVSVGKFNFIANGKALGLGENQGFVKIVSDNVTHEILGAVVAGPEATELLPELVLAANAELTPEEIAHTIHAHPTLNEVVMEAAHSVFGKAVHSV